MSLPVVPEGQENFYYASQTSFWIYYRVDRAGLLEIGPTLEELGLTLPRFREDDSAYVALTPMFYTAMFGRQDTHAGWPGMAGISEIEFNVVAQPSKTSVPTPDVSFQEYLLGWEQQKQIGHFRLAVACNHEGAVRGGRDKYGEHKFLADIDFTVSTPNNNAKRPEPFSIDFSAYPWGALALPASNERMMFRLKASVDELTPVSCDFSPVVVYGALPPEAAPGVRRRLIGSRRSHLGLFDTYFTDEHRGTASIEFGACESAPTSRASKGEIPDSANWPREMRLLMESILSRAELAAFQVFQSVPVETEPRPYFVYAE